MLEHADGLWTKQQMTLGSTPSLRLMDNCGKAGKAAQHFGTSDARPFVVSRERCNPDKA